MKHQEFDSMLPAYALDALESDELRAMEAHLQGGCAECEQRLADYRRVSGGLLLSAEERSPRPQLKADLLRRLAAPAVAEPSGWTRLLAQWKPLSAGLAALALLLWIWGGPRRTPPIPTSTAPVAPAPTKPEPAAPVQTAALRHPRPASGAPARIAALPQPLPAARPAAPALPRLTLQSGTALQAGLPVATGGSLAWGPAVYAGRGGAEVAVQGRALLLLKAGAEINVSRERSRICVDLPRGTLFSAVVPGTAFSVRAAGVRIDAHGTVFMVDHARAHSVYVCICRGSIGVNAPGLRHELRSSGDAQENGLNLTMTPDGALAQILKSVYYGGQEDVLQADLNKLMVSWGKP